MENKSFVDAYQEINNRLIRLVGSMSALRELSSMEFGLVDEKELLNNSIRILLANHELDYVAVFMEKNGVLNKQASLQWEEEKSKETNEHPALIGMDLLAQDVFKSGKAQYKRDLTVDGEIGSAICLPVTSSDRHIGVMCAYYPDPDFFTQQHERSLLIFCNFLAQSVMNNRLLMNMEQLVQQRTEQLQHALDEAHELKVRYEQLSIVDELTSLHNRRFFFPEAHTHLAAAMRYEKPLSIVMIDIDRFKHINDQYGHAMGDDILKVFADILSNEKRDADILARYGGEEFVMLLTETNRDGAEVFAERVRVHIESHTWDMSDKNLQVTASFGVSSLQLPENLPPTELLDSLLQQADTALYKSKSAGRNRVSSFTELSD